MSDGPSKLDALRIDRAAPPPRRASGFLIVVLVILAVLAAGGAAAYVWWPSPGIPVQAVTAEADGAAAGGAGLDATGYVVARRKATLSAKILGKLTQVNVEEGQRIEKDQVVARLDDSNYLAALHEAQAQERQTKAALDDAGPIYARYQRLREQGAISADMFENQKAAFDASRTAFDVSRTAVALAESNENDTTIRAPYSGIVTDKAAQVGEIVAPSAAGGGDTRTGIATIVDMDSLEIEVDVSENYIDRVRAQGQATVVLDAYPEWEIPASVIAVIPTADQTKGTVKVRVGIKAKDPRILPQMGARVTFLTDARSAATPVSHGVRVPLQAVQIEGRSGRVFVIGEDDAVRTHAVTLGLKTAQSIIILSGVAAGDRLVAGDLGKLHDGAKIAVQQ